MQLVERSGLSQRRSLEVIELISSRYYRWRSKYPDLEDKKPVAQRILHKLLPEEKEKVIAYALAFPELRHRKLAYHLEREEKVFVSPSSCYRILKLEGLVCAWEPKLITRKECAFKTIRPNQQWQIDICYIPVADYFMYLILILDDYSRYIVYFELCWSMSQADVRRVVDFALLKAGLIEAEEKPELLSDNGPQLLAISFRQYLKKLGITHLRAGYRHPEGKGKIERVFRTIKYEEVFPAAYQSSFEAEQGIKSFIDYYNHERLHQGIDYVTPYERYTGKDQEILNQRKERRKKAEEKRKSINSRMDPSGQLKLTELCERSQTLTPS
jgi:transposase InsO family protein